MGAKKRQKKYAGRVKKTKMAVLRFSGHLLSRYIVHLGLKNTTGLISEVVGPQNPVKKLILMVFRQFFWRIGGGFFSYIENKKEAPI